MSFISHIKDFECENFEFCCSDNGKKVTTNIINYLHVMTNIYRFSYHVIDKYCFKYNCMSHNSEGLCYCVYYYPDEFYGFDIYHYRDGMILKEKFDTIYELYDYLNTNYIHLRKEPTHKLAIEQ